MDFQDIHKEILGLCADDDIGLWLIIKRVAKDDYIIDSVPEWGRQKTLEVLRDLLQNGLIGAGNFQAKDSGGYEFQPLKLSTDEVINYIEREWDELGKTPNIGDICWFRATLAGEKLADDLGLKM